MEQQQSLRLGLSVREGVSSKTRTISERLLVMQCPYLEGMEDLIVEDVIFTPGEARTRILQWLVGQFHPRFQDILFVTDISMTTIPRLTSLLSDMGLCSREDYELVRGTTMHWKQVQLMESLLYMVEMSGWDSLDDSLSSLDCCGSKAEQCCLCTDALCRQEDLGSVFSNSAAMLPPDITLRDVGGSSANEKRIAVPPSLQDLRKEMEETRTELRDRQSELELIMQTHTYAELHSTAMESCYKTLTVSLSTLQQLITNFCHCYETELQPWANRQPPELNSLGPTCKRINIHMQHLNKLLHALEQLETSFSNLQQLKDPPTKDNIAIFSEICKNGRVIFEEFTTTIGSMLIQNTE